MKSSTFASKSLYGGNSLVGHSKINSGVEPKLDMSDLIDSNVVLLMYLIEGIRFGT